MSALPKKSEYVALDLETTGLVAGKDRVVEIGAVRFDESGQELGRFEQLVDPCCDIPGVATAVHGITNEMVAGKHRTRDRAG